MGYPVEQQKYQSLGNLVLKLASARPRCSGYRHELDLDTAIATTTYEQAGVRFRREVFVTPVDQVIVVRLTADAPGSDLVHGAAARRPQPGALELRHRLLPAWTATATDGLVVRGKSADYLGVAGQAALPVPARGRSRAAAR